MSLLELDNINKSFYINKQPFKVLKGISLNFESGEFVSLLGESGVGKSTLMNIIGGLDSQYQGDVKLNGHSIKNDTNKQLDEYRRKTIGFIFQNFNLIGHMSILDNVLVPLKMSSLSRHQQIDRAKQLLTRVGLSDHINKHPNQLSGGQKQRVSIARALAANPDIIIADEPTGALDSKNTDEVLKLLNEIAKEGKLVITVTHSDKVAEYGTRIIHMQDGQIDYDKQLRDRYQVQTKSNYQLHALSIPTVFMMSLKQLLYNWKRNLLIIFGSAIGIFSVIFMLGLGNGIKGYINHEIYNQVNPNSIQVAKNKNGTFNDKDINKLSRIKNVDNVQKVAIATGAQINNGGKSINAQSAETYNSTINSSSIKAGHTPTNNEVLLTKAIAKQIDKSSPYSVVGKQIKVSFTIVNDQRPVSVTKAVKISGVTDSSMQSVYPSYETLKDAFKIKHVALPTTFAVLNVKGNVQTVPNVQKQIKAFKNGNGKQLYFIAGLGSMADTLNTYVNLAVAVLAAIAAISLLVSAIMIIVVLYISVAERTKEIGTLRALGISKGNIRNLFFSDAILLAIFASLIAIIIAYLLGMGINNAIHGFIGYPIVQITANRAITILIIEIIINLLAAILPASKAAKLDPIQSLNYE